MSVRLARVAAFLALMVLLPGCTLIRVTYNNAEPLVRYTAHDYFDLDEGQTGQFRKRLQQFHDWHRSTELPLYAGLLRAAVQRGAHAVSREDVTWAAQAVRERYAALITKAIGDAAPILATLTPAQIAELEKRLAKANAKYAKEYLTDDAEARHRAQFKRTLGRFSDWTGGLSDQQEARIERFVKAHAKTTAMRFDNRARWQSEAVSLIRRHRSPGALAPPLTDLFTRPAAHRTPELNAALARWEADLVDLIVDLDRTLSAEQRAYAVRRIERFAEDFEVLSAQGAVAVAAN